MESDIEKLTQGYVDCLHTYGRTSYLEAIALVLGDETAQLVQARGDAIIEKEENERRMRNYLKRTILEN